jgi:hypothetical protein
MKKSLLPLAFLALGTAAFAQVENGDFENWNKYPLFPEPSMDVDAISSNYEIFVETGLTNVTQVEHDNGSAMRLENIEIGEGVTPAFYIFGKTPDQVGEDLVFPGGMPASDPNVTGISVDMSYDFPGEASGFVIVQFKMNDIPVGPGTMGSGTFFFPVSGQQDWENTIFDFEEAMGVEYDEVVIGFATADLIGSDSDFPSGSWMEIDNLSFINSNDAIPNGDFELWVQLTPIYYPTKVDVDIDLIHPTYMQSTDVADGQYALGLITRDFDGFLEPSKATLGTVEVEGEVATFDLNENDAILNFDYKYLADNDVAEAVVTFFQESEESLVPVYVKTIDLEPIDSYETVELNFLDELNENFITATKMSIEFSSSKENGSLEANSLLLLDNVEVTGALSFFTPLRHIDQLAISAFPNPTLGRVAFDFGMDRTGFYRVYNNQGYLIDFVDFQNKTRLVYSLFNLPSGQYTFRFYHEEGTRVVRVIKN